MKIKSILVSQPVPSSNQSPYHELMEKQKVKIDFRSFIHVEGECARNVRDEKRSRVSNSVIPVEEWSWEK